MQKATEPARRTFIRKPMKCAPVVLRSVKTVGEWREIVFPGVAISNVFPARVAGPCSKDAGPEHEPAEESDG